MDKIKFLPFLNIFGEKILHVSGCVAGSHYNFRERIGKIDFLSVRYAGYFLVLSNQ